MGVEDGVEGLRAALLPAEPMARLVSLFYDDAKLSQGRLSSVWRRAPSTQ